VVDEERQVEFYAARIPERVNSVAAFNHWRAEAERTNPRLLYMSRADLMQRDAEEAGAERFPDAFPVGANQLPLQYRFEPAESGDGITLIVPEPLIDMVNAEQTAWLVPGLRLEKITAAFRALPKAQRKMLVPVPDFAKRALDDLAAEEARLGRLPAYHEWMAQWITQHVGAAVKASEVAALDLPDHLRINFRVLDAQDRVIAEGRDLLAVKRRVFEVEQRAREGQGGQWPGVGSTQPAGFRGGTQVESRTQAGDHAQVGQGVHAGTHSVGKSGNQVARNARAGAHGASDPGARIARGPQAVAHGSRNERSSPPREISNVPHATSGARQAAQSGQSPGDTPSQSAPAGQQRAQDARADSGRDAGPSRGAEATPSGRSAEHGGLSLREALAGLALGTHTSAPESARGGVPHREVARTDSQTAASNRSAAVSHAPGASSNRQPVQSRGRPVPTGQPSSSAPGRNVPPAPPARATVAPPPPPLHRQWDFGDLPESREVERNRLRLVVYPAVEDRGSGVVLVEARNAIAAESISRAGLVRLAMLALPQQAKYVHKRVADDRELVLLSGGLALSQSLADALTQRAFRECFLPAEGPLPRTAQDFNKLLDNRRAQLSEVADRLAGIVMLTLKEWRAARAGLSGIRSGATYADVVSEIDAQLQLLLPPDFIETTPRPWLDYLPRYLKAIARRIERLPPNVRRDAELSAKVRPFTAAMRSLMAQPALSGVRPELDELRWMIEEFRVSLFAQELKTMIRVSEKRLQDQLALAREAQR
jgi:hypothetical protein